ncbi:hypothetical protein [Segniliparus rugosus]|uniref:Uncharacterized protein n=1 Tax=Segniliparus rugosus (strain ATCC BAA-974 / DSM 45345 / CCUG 50838 / CIP 108380 / JCM 13579 / CDC 945) TaxID=679197 RepID=E5XT48_SEGRC|nr:hypothetical protein [Segniliparus rugosus]EFV12459.2 hypothetical protein HMPREF9336_02670 [Segniliparus rugosus ATCC BAA-974]
MSEIGSRPYPEPFGEVQKLVAEPVWLGVNEVELADLAQTLRSVAELERASGNEIHSHAGRLEDNHAGGGLDAGPEALRRDALALHIHAERCDKAAAILDEAAMEVREAKVELSVLGAYAQQEQNSWDVLLKQTANSRWVQKLAAKSLQKAQDAAKARADKAEAFFAAKIREHDKLHEEEIAVGHVDLDEVDGPASPSVRHAAVETSPAPAVQEQSAETEAERVSTAEPDPFEQHRNLWPQHDAPGQARAEHEWPADFGTAHDSSAATSVQSGAAVFDHADTDSASTELMSATGLDVPDDVTTVDLQESSDTATMGAAGAVTGQALNLANTDEEYRSPGARGYHGGEGLFGDRHAAELPQDQESRLARLALWVKEQPDLFDIGALATGGPPRYAFSLEVDDQLQEHVFAHTNVGPGVLSKRLPLGTWNAWDVVMDPDNHDRAVLPKMLGHADPVHGLVAHYLWRRGLWEAHNARYHLAGIALAYTPEEPETLRRLVQPLNNNLPDVEAPFLVEAKGPLVEPEGGSLHPLQHAAPGLFKQLQNTLDSHWAEQLRPLVPHWVAAAVERSGANGRPAFDTITTAIRNGQPVTPEMFGKAREDAGHGLPTMRAMLDQAAKLPEAAGGARFAPYLNLLGAQLAYAALTIWAPTQAQPTGTGLRWILNAAYLVVKATDSDPAFIQWITSSLPDLDRSPWKQQGGG